MNFKCIWGLCSLVFPSFSSLPSLSLSLSSSSLFTVERFRRPEYSLWGSKWPTIPQSGQCYGKLYLFPFTSLALVNFEWKYLLLPSNSSKVDPSIGYNYERNENTRNPFSHGGRQRISPRQSINSSRGQTVKCVFTKQRASFPCPWGPSFCFL